MSCYHPMPAVRLKDGSVAFKSRWARGVEGDLYLPCGQCIGCRLERARQWAVRCVHEASFYDASSFVTFTYSDANLPEGGTLVYRDFQLFMKRLRKVYGRVPFYVGGEYGEQTKRPHFHACLFGIWFADRKPYSKGVDGSPVYTSAECDELWRLGECKIGSVSYASAGYIARYCVAKVTGDLAAAHYRVVTDDGVIVDRVPEFNHMSLKPAVGKRWFERYWREVYPRDFVVVNGVKVKPPKAYDRWMEEIDGGMIGEVKEQREMDCLVPAVRADNSWDRLLVKERVHRARVSFLSRS